MADQADDVLRRLLGDEADGRQIEDFRRRLGQLAQDLTTLVPSCASISLLIAGLDGEIAVMPRADGALLPVRASLALPVGRRGMLILRASLPGAFLLLPDDLQRAAGRFRFDTDLGFDSAMNQARLDASLDAGHWIAVATGMLMDRAALDVTEASRELEQLAAAAGLDLAVLAQRLCSGSWPAFGV